MELTSDLGGIKLEILDRLRDKPCRDRIDLDVFPADSECGWSAISGGDLSNNDRRDFVAAVVEVQRALHFSPV